MKKFMLVVLLAIAVSSSSLEAQEKYVQCPVSHVTVFRHGAQLSGDAVVTLQAAHGIMLQRTFSLH
jgi:hypothetical protein